MKSRAEIQKLIRDLDWIAKASACEIEIERLHEGEIQDTARKALEALAEAHDEEVPCDVADAL